jgi:hypothetical protein
MTFKERLKQDPKFREKITKASMFFGGFVIIVVCVFAVLNQGEAKAGQLQDGQISGNYIPSDTAKFADDKNFFYTQSTQDSLNNIKINADGNPLVNSINGVENAPTQEKNTDTELAQYMKDREKSVQRMQSSTPRSYNPNGNRSDWTSVPTTVTSTKYNESTRYNDDGTTYPQDITKTNGKMVKARLLSQKDYVSSGETLVFVLLEPFTINGYEAKKGQTVTGITQEQGKRLIMRFTTIKIGNEILPANMKLFGEDGLEGFSIIGSNEKSYGEKKGGEVVRNVVRNIPGVGGMISDASQQASKTDERIKVTKNISCTIVIYKN